MNHIDSAFHPDRFELEAQAHEHRTEVVDALFHGATEWVESHVRDVAHRLGDIVAHHHGTAH